MILCRSNRSRLCDELVWLLGVGWVEEKLFRFPANSRRKFSRALVSLFLIISFNLIRPRAPHCWLGEVELFFVRDFSDDDLLREKTQQRSTSGRQTSLKSSLKSCVKLSWRSDGQSHRKINWSSLYEIWIKSLFLSLSNVISEYNKVVVVTLPQSSDGMKRATTQQQTSRHRERVWVRWKTWKSLCSHHSFVLMVVIDAKFYPWVDYDDGNNSHLRSFPHAFTISSSPLSPFVRIKRILLTRVANWVKPFFI